MKSHSKLPINGNLHLLLGGSTITYAASDLGQNYAINLAVLQQTIINAWYNAGTYTYSYQNGTNMIKPVKFAYAGWSTCIYDQMTAYQDPGGSITYGQQQVYP